MRDRCHDGSRALPCETPVPSWERADLAVDVLPQGDPALDPGAAAV